MKNIIMDEVAIKRAISRISFEIIEKNKGIKDIILIGIITRGVNIANRISDRIYEIEGIRIPVYSFDITNYRDDIGVKEYVKTGFIHEDINNKKIVLVDDVLFTGRSVRAAIDGILIEGRPSLIELVVLIDRGHRELPIRPDFVGKNVPTSKTEQVKVNLIEEDGTDEVFIEK